MELDATIMCASIALYTQTQEHFLYEYGYGQNDKKDSFTASNTMFVCLLKSRHLLDQEAHFHMFILVSIVVAYMYIYTSCTCTYYRICSVYVI